MNTVLKRLENIVALPPTAYKAEIEAAVSEIKRLRLALSDITHYRGNLDSVRSYARKTLDADT
jgi:hypothetical protein